MKVAVVTPYYKEDLNTLARCRNSVRDQTYKDVVYYMVADGYPRDYVEDWGIKHIVLPGCADYGDTPRLIGSAVAMVNGADAIMLLDADCWIDPMHIDNMVTVMKMTQADVVTCPRKLYRSDGSFMAVDRESDGKAFNDTNCYLVGKPKFGAMATWGFKDKAKAIVGDRYFWKAIVQSGSDIARNPVATVNYTTTFAFHYQQEGETPPDDSKIIVDLGEGLKTYSWSEYQERKV